MQLHDTIWAFFIIQIFNIIKYKINFTTNDSLKWSQLIIFLVDAIRKLVVKCKEKWWNESSQPTQINRKMILPSSAWSNPFLL